ncbi:FecR family protein [Carboxylicivirga sp. N1Y90]|uniref:FecR family protein n=1 Tax=Carboxylicivirga fragile TaxID=3417571 RepID=UPI003D33C7AC|nr:FecR family protein [Marinilabiliaceae bacterium N1Y90]
MKRIRHTKKYIELAELLAKKTTKQLDDSEQKQLDELMQQEQISTDYKEVFKNDLTFVNIEKYKHIDTVAARAKIEWQLNFKRAHKRNKRLEFLRYAAAILSPIIIALWLVYGTNEVNKELQTETYTLQAGETKAQLFLSDGRVIDLEKDHTAKIKEADGRLVLNDSTGLRYQINETNINSDEATIINKVRTPVGGEYQLTLSDGTKIWLNAMSEIQYPVKFGDKNRKVMVKGEAYFEVAKDVNRPFIVEADKVEIKVLGTQFNIMAYSNEQQIETTLVEGSVELNSLQSNSSKTILTPGHQASYQRTNQKMSVREVDTDKYTAWHLGKFIFEEQTLESIMRQMERWYDIDVFYEHQDLKNYRFSARLQRYDNCTDIFKKMELTTDITFNINNKTVVVSKQ